MRMTWEAETERLRCQWSEAGRYVQYNPRWMEPPGKRGALTEKWR